MTASERAQQDNADDADAGGETDSAGADHEGRLSGPDTSVRVRWRIDTIEESVDSRPDTAEPEQVTLVQLRLRNPASVAQRIRLQNSLEGPVLFPRRQGVPEAGWDREGFVGVVDAESERALGYACPAPVQTPPIALQQAEGSRQECGAESTHHLTPEAVVRTYGDSAPPVAVGHDARYRGTQHGGPDAGPRSSEVQSRAESRKTAPPAEPETTGPGSGQVQPSTPPAPVTAWLDGIESQVVRAEALEGATVPEATAILAEGEGLDPVLDDVDQLSMSAGQLQALAERAGDLAARAETVEVAEQSLRRLA